jgi:pSer/pThr/pTyr-binding forkhead associated (FHA) protein
MDTQDVDKTMIAQQSAEATVIGTTVVCPVCRTENAPTEKYCGECGFLLSSTPGEEAPTVEAGDQPRLVDSSGLREYFLHEGENGVGREAADVLLADPSVSRRHAAIILEGGKCLVEDKGSTNGTFVAGKQVQAGEKVELSDGVELKFGSSVLTLKLPVVSGEVEQVEEAEEAPAEEAAPEEVEVPEAAETAEAPAVNEETPQAQAAAYLVSAADETKKFAVVHGTNTVGRRAENDVAISDDPYVSGSHAELVADERGFWLTDVGSTNGTVLNGSRIESGNKMALNPGDEIVFGRSAFKLEFAEQIEPEPAAEGEAEETDQ